MVTNITQIRQQMGGVVPSNRGVSAATVYKQNSKKLISDSTYIAKANESSFEIHFKIADKDYKYTFYYMPAIEASLQLSTNSQIRGSGGQVPEVKPGVVDRITKRVKNQIVPGGTPIAQMIGVENNVLQLCGVLSLRDTTSAKTDSNKTGGSASTFSLALWLKQNLVILGSQCRIVINLAIGPNTTQKLEYEGSVLNLKYYLARHDLSYFTFDFLVTNYK